MLTLYDAQTQQPLFRSDSIWGILDLIFINWGNHPNFKLTYDSKTNKIEVFNREYDLLFTERATRNRANQL